MVNAFVPESPQLMAELRLLKIVLESHGLTVRAEWIPTLAKRYADALSRRICTDALQILQQLRCYIKNVLEVPRDGFRFHPVG